MEFVFWILILAAGAFVLFIIIVSADVDSKNIKNYEKDLRESIIHSQPEWDEIKDIAASRKVSKNITFVTLLTTKREILTGRDKDLGGQ